MRKTTLALAAIFLFAMTGLTSDLTGSLRPQGVSAVPQATPEKPLDEEAVEALLEELRGGLEAIGDIWDAREDLAGKTKTQILNMLMADVRSVVKDKETQDMIWKSWGGEDKGKVQNSVVAPKAPAPPHPPPVAPAKPKEQSTCRANGGAAILREKQTYKALFIKASYTSIFATGTVRCYNEPRGFGYIIADDGGPDVFVHFTAINMDGHRFLQEGQKVQFELLIGPEGQRTAVNVRTA